MLNQRGIINGLVALIFFAAVAASIYLVLQTRNASFEQDISNASFILTKQANVGDKEVAVEVHIRSDSDEVNLLSAKIIFPKEYLKVVRIDTNSTFIKNWVENTFDNNMGTISLIGGIPNPGYKTTLGETGLMATIYFEIINVPQEGGSVVISLDELSAIYRNSDNLNILSDKKGLEIKVEENN